MIDVLLLLTVFITSEVILNLYIYIYIYLIEIYYNLLKYKIFINFDQINIINIFIIIIQFFFKILNIILK